jgi:hypothetical protein
MRAVLFGAFVLLMSVASQAADSTWLLCNNGSLVINSLERRDGGSNRATNIKMLMGLHIFEGELKNADSGNVVLKGKSSQDFFVGTVNFDYNNKILSIKGGLKIDGQGLQVPAQRMPCKLMTSM